jgi:hypothetical protein
MIDPKACQRCGLPEIYHTSGQFKCRARKKPYKLRDGGEVKLGMRVWHYHPWSHPEDKIITGIVVNIFDWGSITLRKDPEDKESIFDFHYSPSFSAWYSCFSTLENAEAFKKKCEEKRAKRDAYIAKWDKKLA